MDGEGVIVCGKCNATNRINSTECKGCKQSVDWHQSKNGITDSDDFPVKSLDLQDRYGSSRWVNGEGDILFRVWAHDVAQVSVIGDFNNWNRQKSYFLYLEDENCGNEENIYSGIINIGSNIEQIEYHFLLEYSNGRITEVNDARAIVLTPSPSGLNSVLKKIDLDLYSTSDNYKFVRKNLSELVIYELHIGSFGELKQGQNNGTFKSIIDRIEYLQILGINAVEIMPIHQDLHQNCWGYDPISLFAIHRSFGSPHEFRDLVQKFHDKDIAVIIDWVPNHICPYNILSSYRANTEKNLGVYFYPDKERRLTGYGPRLNYTLKQVRSYILDSAITLFRYYNVDGIRVDSTITMRNAGVELLEVWTLLQSINDYVHQHFPGRFMIAEDLQDKREVNSVMGFDSQWDAIYHTRVYQMITCVHDHQRSMECIREVMLSSYSNNLTSRIVYVENHDTAPSNRENRLPHAIVNCNNINTDNKFFASKRATLAVSLLFCTPGMPMILQGQENPDPTVFKFPQPPTINFDHKNEDNVGLFELNQLLISLRRNLHGNSKGLTGNNSNIYHLNDDSKIIVIHRYDVGGPGDDVIAIFNCSNNTIGSYRIGIPRAGVWHVRFNSDSKYFCDVFQDDGIKENITAEEGWYDGHYWHLDFGIGRYSALILSQDPPYSDPIRPVVYD